MFFSSRPAVWVDDRDRELLLRLRRGRPDRNLTQPVDEPHRVQGELAVHLGYDQALLATVAESLARAVMQDMRWAVKERHCLASVEPLHVGVFMVVQRFRSDLGLYVHLHCLVTDGAFEERGAEVRFLPAPAPTPERMTAVLAPRRRGRCGRRLYALEPGVHRAKGQPSPRTHIRAAPRRPAPRRRPSPRPPRRRLGWPSTPRNRRCPCSSDPSPSTRPTPSPHTRAACTSTSPAPSWIRAATAPAPSPAPSPSRPRRLSRARRGRRPPPLTPPRPARWRFTAATRVASGRTGGAARMQGTGVMPACARPSTYVPRQTHDCDAAVLMRRHLPGSRPDRHVAGGLCRRWKGELPVSSTNYWPENCPKGSSACSSAS
jgi:hypothetical protein